MHMLGCSCSRFCESKVAATKETEAGRAILVRMGLMKPDA